MFRQTLFNINIVEYVYIEAPQVYVYNMSDLTSSKETASKTKNGVITTSLLVMLLTHILVHSAGNIRGTIFPILKQEFSLTNQQIGLIVAIPSLIQIFFTLPTGYLSDRLGARKIIATSVLLAAIGAALAGFSLNPTMYIVATTLLTLNSTLYHPPSQSYISNTSSSKNRARALGI